MSISLDIKFKRVDKVYQEGENVTGIIIIQCNNNLKHDGIALTMEGAVNLQVSSKNVGILEAFYNAVKPIQLLHVVCEVSGPGRLPNGCTEIPFELPLQSRPNRTLYETYHGVYVNIIYSIRLQYKPKKPEPPRPISFNISPASLSIGGAGAPDFLLKGKLDSARCSVSKPFTGHLILERCEVPIRSLELQLVRVETCGCAEGYSRDATEIQNIQIGDGNIPHNVPIPIYMIFPRLFTCPTLITPNFKIEFEVNIVIVFYNDHLVTENFPIILTREL
ncbi:Down syndrome critical region protein 3 isoform X2 [Agrilus planipennis]|uniref:Vacuolar protein sorting-associated protein 26C n=1 Tax=Agrilus planipennis TaxID=224129 RepID=A0A1W4X4Z4_AGRPL|nr:Down syndrome critical region protein 3 isoform X2 [Agrilus planipennis]